MAKNFEIDHDSLALSYVRQHQDSINLVACLLGVSPLGIAGSIMREITAAQQVYTFGNKPLLTGVTHSA